MINIWGNYRTAKGVKLNMKYASWAPLLECEAIVTSISPKETRVVADCGKSNSDSAISRTQDALRAPMFEEHIAATLNKRAFNRNKVDAKEYRGGVPEPRRNAARSIAEERRGAANGCGARPLSGSDVGRVERLARRAAEPPDGDAKLPGFVSEIVVDAPARGSIGTTADTKARERSGGGAQACGRRRLNFPQPSVMVRRQ